MLFRKLLLSAAVLALLATSAATFAAGNSTTPGCYIAAPASVNEGENFTATVTCINNPDVAPVFGFEFNTTFASPSNYASVAVANANSYTAGDFVTNALDNLVNLGPNVRNDAGTGIGTVYAVTRQGTDTQSGTFTLGSFDVTVPFGLTGDDSSATIAFPSGSFKLSDNSGAAIDDLQSSPDATVIIHNLQIAMLDGTVKVASDGTMTNVRQVSLLLGTPDVGSTASPSTDATQAGSFHNFVIGGTRYTNDMTEDVTVSMESHLSCSVTDTLVDGANDAAAKIGTTGTFGTITLYAGDAVTDSNKVIDIADASAIGANFGTAGTPQIDINGDGVVNIYDLVQVGRNYGQHATACGTSDTSPIV